MGYIYPRDFPQRSRAHIEARKIQAGWELDEFKWNARWVSEVEAEVGKYILRVFLAFAEEALELGRQGVWTVQYVDTQAREFLNCLTLEAQFDKGHDQHGNPILPLVGGVFGEILPEVRRKFEKSIEWRHYQQGLLEVANVQALAIRRGSSQQAQVVAVRGRVEAEIAGARSIGASRPKSLRGSSQSEAIDVELRRIADALPKSHAEVFLALEGRVKVPGAEPFASAGGWMSGFRRDKAAARAWLSRVWHRLNLPPFPRGPKK